MAECVNTKLAKRLLELRQKRRWSQSSLAARMTALGPTKVAQSEISDLECGKDTIGMKRLEKLAKALNVPISEFFK